MIDNTHDDNVNDNVDDGTNRRTIRIVKISLYGML